jgi:elongator complex protein 3
LRDEEGDLHRLKNKISHKYCLDRVPTNPEILAATTSDERELLTQRLRIKPIRSLSGVSVVAVMTPPQACPHGRCAYCPNVPGVPNSYTGREPSAMRGLQNSYDAYSQVHGRIAQLTSAGHHVSKVELIVQGGTFPATDRSSQEQFVKGCLDAITSIPSRNLLHAKTNAEHSLVRNVGMTFETRPDYCSEKDIDSMLDLGVTRVEIGVQTINDNIYKKVERGHTVKDVIDSSQRLRDAGLKICYHMMPGLPGADPRSDAKTFEDLFSNPSFMPDMLKIYPCLVLEGTKIHEWWLKGEFKPYTTEEAVDLLSHVKVRIPQWVRIMRVQRDIPSPLIIAGIKKSNIRQLIHEHMLEQNLRCRCIRCREIGHQVIGSSFEDAVLSVRSYDAGGGKEFCISVEDVAKDSLIAYLRLRLPSKEVYRPEIKVKPSALVRELHVYGSVVSVGNRDAKAWQHRGFGKSLLQEAEQIALEEGAEQILVTSALGARDYFRKLDYQPIGVYMGKNLRNNQP